MLRGLYNNLDCMTSLLSLSKSNHNSRGKIWIGDSALNSIGL